MLAQIDWLILVATLPARNTAARMRLWRALKALGCATLRDGVYLLPARDETGVALRAQADEVRAAGGAAEVLSVAADGAQDAAFRVLFDRSEDYGRLLDAIHAARPNAAPKIAHALRREFRTLAATDHFPGAARAQVEAALAELDAIASGEPHAAPGVIHRLASADFSGRTWATRAQLWVDRLASAWLIRRFIDPDARFLWLARPADCPPDALGFDFDGARFGHLAATAATPERVTFETLAASFGLDADPALARIGAIVHCLDVGGAPVAETAGIEAVLAGLRASAAGDDDKLLGEASRVLDGLYQNYSDNHNQENPDD
jgi:hypothetical protein